MGEERSAEETRHQPCGRNPTHQTSRQTRPERVPDNNEPVLHTKKNGGTVGGRTEPTERVWESTHGGPSGSGKGGRDTVNTRRRETELTREIDSERPSTMSTVV